MKRYRLVAPLTGAVLTAVAVLGAACGGGSPAYVPDVPGMNANRYANLQQLASEKLGCPEQSLSYRRRNLSQDVWTHVMSGCGDSTEYFLHCTGWCQWVPFDLDRRASFDMDCPETEIHESHLGGLTFGAQGCGERRTYVFVQGTWVADSASSRAN